MSYFVNNGWIFGNRQGTRLILGKFINMIETSPERLVTSDQKLELPSKISII